MKNTDRWTGYIATGGDTETTGYGLGHGGFAGTEVTIKTDHIASLSQLAQAVSEGFSLNQAVQGKMVFLS